MENLIEKFSNLKEMLSKRASTVLGEAMLKSFLLALDEYQDKLILEISKSEKKMFEIKEENKLLLDISGASMPVLRAGLLKQGQEIRFLRQQLLNLKTNYQKKEEENDSLLFKIEDLKISLEKNIKEREIDQLNFKKNLDLLSGQLENFSKKITEKEIEVENRKKENDKDRADIDSVISTNERVIYNKAEKEIYNVISIVSNSYINFYENLSLILKNIDSIKAVELQQKSKKVLFKKSNNLFFYNAVDQLSSQIDSLRQKSYDINDKLSVYLKLFEQNLLKYEKLDWVKLWDTLKRRYLTHPQGKNIKIIWPNEKKYPVFFTDFKTISEICGCIIQNAIDSIETEGVLKIEFFYDKNKINIIFSDNGSGIKSEYRERIFEPFFSTKEGHIGIGLNKARQFLNRLNGNISYNFLDPGSKFIITLPEINEKPS